MAASLVSGIYLNDALIITNRQNIWFHTRKYSPRSLVAGVNIKCDVNFRWIRDHKHQCDVLLYNTVGRTMNDSSCNCSSDIYIYILCVTSKFATAAVLRSREFRREKEKKRIIKYERKWYMVRVAASGYLYDIINNNSIFGLVRITTFGFFSFLLSLLYWAAINL